ncbi:MAG: hypothetical protein JWQ85_3786 [Mucilaginibacter sp.]|nr:hypothetical protein [Mucilaginibacter sp.]
MVKIFRFISRLSIVAIIFFALQGEIIMRYGEILQAKAGHHTSKIKNTAERERLIKLQCFTQKFYPVVLPPETEFNFNVLFVFIPKLKFYQLNVPAGKFDFTDFQSLRGPPTFA